MLMSVHLDFVLDDLAENEGEKLLMVCRLVDILSEALVPHQSILNIRKEDISTHPLKRLLDAHLLCTDEAANRDLNSKIDIVRTDVFPQVHLCARLGHADHRFQMSHGDGKRAGGERLSTQIRV